MKYKKYIEVLVEYDSQETWDETEMEMREILDMFNNLKRRVKIMNIEQGVDSNVNDGQD